MTATTFMNRRGFFGLAAGAALAAARPREALAALPAQPSPSTLLTQAHKALAQYQARNPLRDRVGIADFSQPSRAPRFYLIDLEGGQISAHLVSHGRGSDPAHTGLLHRFSNDEGSFASSEGCYLTASHYVGKHGRSMRLIGLDPTNSNAESRAIVVHAATYVSPEMARTLGKIGRSHGCFAFAPAELDRMLTALGPGRLILAGRF
ncbi:murein L,D-transpeptidase catalytic domain family protein [Thermaurantiacus sp.]